MKKYFPKLIMKVLILSLCILGLTSTQPGEWKQLFNGKDLTGWEQIGPGKFIVENSTMKSEGGMGMLLYPSEKFGNSVIRVVYTCERQ